MATPRLLLALQLSAVLLLAAVDIYRAQDTSRNTAPLGQHERACNLFIHREVISRDNCTTTLSIASCAGQCPSKSYPKLFYSKSQAEREPEPFEQDCDCCSILDRRIGMRDVNLTCAHNNSVVTHTQFLSVALRCGCSPCGQ